MPSTLTLQTPPNFCLARAVCSYGYFALAPNQWQYTGPKRCGTFHRPLKTTDNQTIHTIITQPVPRKLLVKTAQSLPRSQHTHIKSQINRMLRLDESFTQYHRLAKTAARDKFARLLRSPTLFEDIIKTMTSCNVAWSGTIRMNQRLCEHFGADNDFPTPAELAKATIPQLKNKCKVGYRAQRILKFARDVHSGKLDLTQFQNPKTPTDQLHDALIKIHGIGPYAAANILQHLGRYDRLPIDSETIRHFKTVHNTTGSITQITRAAQKHYAAYHPNQFLAYWHELWSAYEKKSGPTYKKSTLIL